MPHPPFPLPLLILAVCAAFGLSVATGSAASCPQRHSCHAPRHQTKHCQASHTCHTRSASPPARVLPATARAAAAAISVLESSLASTLHISATSSLAYGGGAYSEGNWPGGTWAPYASTSPWNTQLPTYGSATLASNSSTVIGYMGANWKASFTPWTVSNTPSKDTSSAWGAPIYWASASDPTYTIRDTGYSCAAPGSSACPSTVQIPAGAWRSLASGAANLAVVQPDGHTEVDMWQVQNGNPISGAGTITVHAYGALDLNGSGCCGGSTGADQGMAAGAIRGPELASGSINHALAVVAKCTSGTYVAPAVTPAGTCSANPGAAPPVGAHLQLKMSDTAIAALNVPAYQKIILRAMAHYGLYVTGSGGSPMDLSYEPAIQYTSFGNRSNTVMSFLATQGLSDPATITMGLPWSDFQMVSPCYATGTCAAAPSPTDTIPPSTPTGLTASAQTGSSIALGWTASTDNVGVTGYDVYLNNTKLTTTTNTAYTYTGLTCGTTYTLAVAAHDAAGNTSGQGTVQATTGACTDTTAPSTPTGLAASGQTATSVALSWARSSDNVGVTGYDVYLNGAKVGTTTNTTYTYSGLSCGTNYTLAVAAYDAAGNTSGQGTAQGATSACSTGIAYGSGPFGEGSWPGAQWDPYGASSPWNTQLPAYTSAALDPNNASEMSYVASSWGAPFTPWPVSNTPSQDEASAWSHPLYWAKSTDPTYTINDTDYQCGAPASTACPTTMQIPNGAWHATGSDGWIGVIQPDGHTEIDAWQVQNANPISGGGTLTVHDYGATDLNGKGCCSGSTAANQGLQAGLIRGPELAGGVISHALTVSVPCTNGLYVAPATGAALGGCGSAPPDGARLQLKMSDAAIAALSVPAYQKVILTAMAHYGIYITDTGGNPAQTDLLYEPAIDYTTFGNTSDTVMSYLKTQGYSDPTTISISLPWSDFQVVNSCYAAGTC